MRSRSSTTAGPFRGSFILQERLWGGASQGPFWEESLGVSVCCALILPMPCAYTYTNKRRALVQTMLLPRFASP